VRRGPFLVPPRPRRVRRGPFLVPPRPRRVRRGPFWVPPRPRRVRRGPFLVTQRPRRVAQRRATRIIIDGCARSAQSAAFLAECEGNGRPATTLFYGVGQALTPARGYCDADGESLEAIETLVAMEDLITRESRLENLKSRRGYSELMVRVRRQRTSSGQAICGLAFSMV
jgi:hypothetical protein